MPLFSGAIAVAQLFRLCKDVTQRPAWVVRADLFGHYFFHNMLFGIRHE